MICNVSWCCFYNVHNYMYKYDDGSYDEVVQNKGAVMGKKQKLHFALVSVSKTKRRKCTTIIPSIS